MKWYLLNTMQRMRFAASHPRYVLKAAVRELTLADERFLTSATGGAPLKSAVPKATLRDADFLARLRDCEGIFRAGRSAQTFGPKKFSCNTRPSEPCARTWWLKPA